MARCGFVTVYDTATNLNNVITITVYPCSVVKQINKEDKHSTYKFARDGFRLIDRIVVPGSDLPYTILLEICQQAVELDKKNEHIITMCFYFDANNNVAVKSCGINKNLFPLPSKNIGYMWESIYANVTNHFLGVDATDNLTASVVCDLLNNVAVVYGITDDRLFEFSCGRLFVNARHLMNSIEGRKLLKQMTDYYDALRKALNVKCTCIRLRRSKPHTRYNQNDNYANDILKAHIQTTRNLCKYDLHHHISNPKPFARAVECEVRAIKSAILKFSEQIPSVKPKDFEYLSILDIMRAYVDADFRYELAQRVEIVRKIYNANKHKNIIYIKSDGSYVC